MYFLLSCINMLVLHCNPQLATKLCRLLDACPLLMSPQDWFLGVMTSVWPHIYMEKSVAESIGTSQILKSFPNQKPHQNQLGQRCKNCSCKSFRAVLSIYISKKYLLKCVRSVLLCVFSCQLEKCLDDCTITVLQRIALIWLKKKLHNAVFATQTTLAFEMNEVRSAYELKSMQQCSDFNEQKIFVGKTG